MNFKENKKNILANWAKQREKWEKPKKFSRAVTLKESPLLYDVWKLSLPLGYIRKKIVMSVTEKEADEWVKDLNNTKKEFIEGCDMKVITYYDKFEQGKPVDLFENPKLIIKETNYEEKA